MKRNGGFTLIELLIVVAIIAILAAIAVPNFLEAQTRAKAGRVRAELRTIATGLESYHLDNAAYPLNDGFFNVLPTSLTTPIAYLTNSRLVDPFTERERDPFYGELARYYTYQKVVDQDEFLRDLMNGHTPPREAIDTPFHNNGALGKYGKWRLVSNGPDRKYSDFAAFALTDPVLWGADIPYDPTNGTLSWGNLSRTQRSTTGELP
jgi:type II secretion system protein G